MPGLSYGFLSSALTATDVQVLSTLTLSTSTYHRSIASLRAPLSQGIYFQSYKLYQEVHGPYCSPKKQFQSILHMWNYHCKIIHVHVPQKRLREKHYPLLENWMFLICILNFSPLYPRVLYDKFGWNQPSGSWEDELIKVSHVLSQKIPFSDQTELMVWGHDLITQYFSSQTCC